MNDQWASNWWIGMAHAKQNAIHQVQLLLAIGTQCTFTCISMTYFVDWGNSHFSHNQNQANVTIKQKNASLFYKIILSVCYWGTLQHDNRHYTCLQVEFKIFTSVKREWKIFLFSVAKARERVRVRLVSPAKNDIKWRHFGAPYWNPCHVCHCELSKYVIEAKDFEKV